MKRTLVFLIATLLLISSCKNDTAKEPLIQFAEPITMQELKTFALNSFKKARQNGFRYVEQKDGYTLVNLKNFQSKNDIVQFPEKLVFATKNKNGRSQQLQVVTELTELEVSNNFQTRVNNLLQVTENLDRYSFEESETIIDEMISEVLTTSDLDENERVSLSQVLEVAKVVLLDAYTAEIEQNLNGRSGDCPINWRKYATAVIGVGIANGLRYAVTGIRAGAITTVVSGNPLIGGIVGGIAGFTVGFIGGAVTTAVGLYAAHEIVCAVAGEPILNVDGLVCLDPFCEETQPAFNPGNISINSGLGSTHFNINLLTNCAACSN